MTAPTLAFSVALLLLAGCTPLTPAQLRALAAEPLPVVPAAPNFGFVAPAPGAEVWIGAPSGPGPVIMAPSGYDLERAAPGAFIDLR